MLQLLKAGKLDEVSKSVSNRVSDLLDCEPIASLITNAGLGKVQMYVEAELIKLAANVNVNPALNLKDYQVPTIASTLIENYKWESIEDFTLCFRRGMAGFYGEIFRIDGAVIGSWLSRYIDEKYDALEQRKAKEKHAEKETGKYVVDKDGKKHPVVDGGDYIKQMLGILGVPSDKSNNDDENRFQRHKLTNQYRYFTVRNIQVMATSQEQAENIVAGMIRRGELEETKD